MEDPINHREQAIRAALAEGRALLADRQFYEVIDLMGKTEAHYSIPPQPYDHAWPFPTAKWFAWDQHPVEPQISHLRDAAQTLLTKLDVGSDRS